MIVEQAIAFAGSAVDWSNLRSFGRRLL